MKSRSGVNQIEAILRTFLILKDTRHNGKIRIVTEFLPRQRCQLIAQLHRSQAAAGFQYRRCGLAGADPDFQNFAVGSQWLISKHIRILLRHIFGTPLVILFRNGVEGPFQALNDRHAFLLSRYPAFP